MIKTLKRVGNSHSVILDKALIEQMDIKTSSKLTLHLDGINLVLTPVCDRIDNETADRLLDEGMVRYAAALQRLS